MKKSIVLYIMFLLLPKESSASIIKNFFTFFTKKKEQHLEAQVAYMSEVGTVISFLNYQLKIFSKDIDRRDYEEKFMRKTQFAGNDLNDALFFNQFLTNRKLVMTMLWEDPQFTIGDCYDMRSYVEKNASKISFLLQSRFTITAEHDQEINIDTLAEFLTKNLYCLKYEKSRYNAQIKEIDSLLNKCKNNAAKKQVNYFECIERNDDALTTFFIRNKIPLEQLLELEERELVMHWRNRIQKSGTSFDVSFDYNQQQGNKLLSVNEEQRKEIFNQQLVIEDKKEEKFAINQIKKSDVQLKEEEKEIIAIDNVINNEDNQQLLAAKKQDNQLMAVVSKIVIKSKEEEEKEQRYIENKIKEINEHAEELSAFLNYQLEFLNKNPEIQEKEDGIMKKEKYTKSDIQKIREDGTLRKVFFNSYLSNRYEIIIELQDGRYNDYANKENAEGFEEAVEAYIRKNFVVKMNNKDVTDAFLSFFPLFAFFMTFEQSTMYKDYKETWLLMVQCVTHIEQGMGNTFASKEMVADSVASLMKSTVSNLFHHPSVPETLLKKASINKQILKTLRIASLKKEMDTFTRQKSMLRDFLNGNLQFCQSHVKNRERAVSLLKKLIMWVTRINTFDIKYWAFSYAIEEKEKWYKKIDNYKQKCIKQCLRKASEYLGAKGFSLRDKNNNMPYGSVKDNYQLYKPLIQCLIEQAILEEFFPRICATKKETHNVLNQSLLLKKDDFHCSSIMRNIIPNYNSNVVCDAESMFVFNFISGWINWLESNYMEDLRGHIL